MLTISPNARHRPSPFFEAALAEGLTAVSIYNHMILPVSYGDPEAEYWRLINGVSQWDVGAERQVQLRGPDAARLAQMLTVRNLPDWPGQICADLQLRWRVDQRPDPAEAGR